MSFKGPPPPAHAQGDISPGTTCVYCNVHTLEPVQGVLQMLRVAPSLALQEVMWGMKILPKYLSGKEPPGCLKFNAVQGFPCAAAEDDAALCSKLTNPVYCLQLTWAYAVVPSTTPPQDGRMFIA